MTTNDLLTRSLDRVKHQLAERFSASMARVLLSAENGDSARQLELATWQAVLDVGRELLAHAFALRCLVETVRSLDQRGLGSDEVTFRWDGQYTKQLTTTMGPVSFPVFAYRGRAPGGVVTHVPARSVFPLSDKCRCSELCVEWSARLASLHPFRKAETLLSYFTHGAVQLEDTTIERHAVRIGHMIDQEWLYCSRAVLLDVLRERATRDTQTGRPILYLSSDAHALRRYVDDSWAAEWKMMNGLRLWCVDQKTGATIHIGGQFTCGDARYVRKILDQLVASGYLPGIGEGPADLDVCYVVVSDGAPWLEALFRAHLPDAVFILDAYHAMQHLAQASERHGHAAKDWYNEAIRRLLGPLAPRRELSLRPRKGHRKRRADKRSRKRRTPAQALFRKHGRPSVSALLEHLDSSKKSDRSLRGYIDNHKHRMDYASYRERGFQIGSGAMESMHRTGSQDRLKRPGARWLPETLEAMFRLTMLDLVGRWAEWWEQPNLFASQAHRFADTAYRTRRGPIHVH